jgi:hypothetical protein
MTHNSCSARHQGVPAGGPLPSGQGQQRLVVQVVLKLFRQHIEALGMDAVEDLLARRPAAACRIDSARQAGRPPPGRRVGQARQARRLRPQARLGLSRQASRLHHNARQAGRLPPGEDVRQMGPQLATP